MQICTLPLAERAEELVLDPARERAERREGPHCRPR